MAAKTPAVAYYRMSSDKQETSIADQRDAVEEYAQQNNHQIVREYIDEGISGDKTEKRISFLQMLYDAEHTCDFDVILCWDQDRFGRFDSLEAGKWICPLRDAGVRLTTIAQGEIDWHDFAGRIIYTIQQEGKNQFLHDLARNSLRGVISRAKQGRWPGGRIPFGYVMGDDGRLALGDPVDVQTIRRIFELRLKNYGYRIIARQLNTIGVLSPSGSTWSHDAVRLILDREAYTGVLILGSKPQGRYFVSDDGNLAAVRGGRRQRVKPLRVEDAHPAIVSANTWKAAKAMKAKPFCRKGGEGAPLAGLLYCGRCGSTMYSQSLQRKTGQRNPNYVCARYHKGKGCGYCTVPQDAMLKAVADVIREKVLQGSFDRLQEAVERELIRRNASDSVAAKRERQQETVEKLNRQIDRAADRLLRVDDSVVRKVEEKLAQLGRDRDAAVAELDSIVTPKSPRLDARRIASQAWRIDDVLRSAPASEARAALSRIVERIDLDFVEGKKTGRGQSFRFDGAAIRLHTKPWPYEATFR